MAAAARPTRARLIPAHAGKTPRRTCPSRRREAHPRSRGENEKERTVIKNREGSSPLTRGKQECAHDLVTARRLIPAHAGKTSRGEKAGGGGAAHPRSRGENFCESSHWRSAGGSSPLTRGKHGVILTHHHEPGLIPAHAGKTPELAVKHSRERGSSPLTRGKLVAYTHGLTEVRLIPAHAGKTPRRAAAALSRSAHPRSRGEN